MEKNATGNTPIMEKNIIHNTDCQKEIPKTVIPKAPRERVAMTKLADNHIVAAFMIESSVFSSSVTNSIPFVSGWRFAATLPQKPTFSEISAVPICSSVLKESVDTFFGVMLVSAMTDFSRSDIL